MDLLDHTPQLDEHSAVTIAAEYFDIQGSATRLPSERDQNFLLTTRAHEKFVLKIANGLEDLSFLEAQNAVFKHLAPRVSFCPMVVPSVAGQEIVSVEATGGMSHLVRLVRYLPGVPLGEVRPHKSELLQDLGRKLGQLAQVLSDFDHPAVHRDFHWDLANGNIIISKYAALIENSSLRDLVFQCRFELNDNLRRSVIHGDANDYNVLVDRETLTVCGLIDFGDMVYSYTVGELAIAIAYVILDKPNPIAAAAEVVAGYTSEFPLLEDERQALWPLVRLRLAMSLCLAAQQLRRQPDNDYLRISQRAIEENLPRILTDE